MPVQLLPETRRKPPALMCNPRPGALEGRRQHAARAGHLERDGQAWRARRAYSSGGPMGLYDGNGRLILGDAFLECWQANHDGVSRAAACDLEKPFNCFGRTATTDAR